MQVFNETLDKRRFPLHRFLLSAITQSLVSFKTMSFSVKLASKDFEHNKIEGISAEIYIGSVSVRIPSIGGCGRGGGGY